MVGHNASRGLSRETAMAELARIIARPVHPVLPDRDARAAEIAARSESEIDSCGGRECREAEDED